jgi:ABC-type branched-subunit amino acid transport system substrate-binding protein
MRSSSFSTVSFYGALALGLATLSQPARAEDASQIKVGMSGALSGPAQTLGRHMKAGIEAYFTRVNSAGGVHGRMLRLIALDDGYEPARAGANVRKLIDEEHVFAILGNPGTPTAAVSVPIANERRVPFFGAFTGAGLLRKTPPDRYVLNFRASYAQETKEMVRGLTHDLGIKPEEIVFMTQNDAYGDAGYAGAVSALKAIGYADAERLTHARYPRNTVDVEDAVARVLDPTLHPRAVIMIGAYKPCAKFIRLTRKHGLRALYVNVSFVIGDSLRKELAKDAEGVIVTQVVPPLDAELPAVREYRESVAADSVGVVSLEGYLAARAFVEGLQRAGPNANADEFIRALETAGPLDLGLGNGLQFSPTRHQLSDQVWPTIVEGGGFRALQNWSEASRYLRAER